MGSPTTQTEVNLIRKQSYILGWNRTNDLSVALDHRSDDINRMTAYHIIATMYSHNAYCTPYLYFPLTHLDYQIKISLRYILNI